MDLERLLSFRRSVRVFDVDQPVDTNKVRECIALATLAPNSSNMQLWEFHHITDSKLLATLTNACLGQSSVKTASEVVVFVVRRDLYRSRARSVLSFERDNIARNSPEDRQAKRIKDRKLYYGNLMPFIYARCFGILGFFRKTIAKIIGLFRPIIYEISESDMRVVAHKSCALAAQTFMLAMANEGYDTSP